MTATVREYLEAEAATPNGWLRREPRATHPRILELVREARAAGLFYDLDVLERVRPLADVPVGPLAAQLAHEIYVAKGLLDDEAALVAMVSLAEDGYVPLADVALEDGGRYTLRLGTVYVGRGAPVYRSPVLVRAKRSPSSGRLGFVRKGHKNFDAGLSTDAHTLVRVGWDEVAS